ncbi:MAG: protein kinase, partial [Chloroflexota bacterium]
LDLTQSTHIITQIGRALAYASRKNLVHHDLKPENILIDDANNVYLSDFGIPRRIIGDAFSSRETLRTLAPLYTSPEQLRSEPVTPQSNVFSMGMLLYHMAAGRLPYDTTTKNLAALLPRHMTTTPPPPRELNRDVPVVLSDVVMKAIAINPNDRYADTDDMVNDLNERLRSLFTRVTIADNIDTRRDRLQAQVDNQREAEKRSQRPYVIASLVSTLLVFAVGAGVVVFGQRTPQAIIVEDRQITAQELLLEDSTVRFAQQRLDDGFLGYYTCSDPIRSRSEHLEFIQAAGQRYGLLARVYRTTASTVPPPSQALIEGAVAIVYCEPPEELLPQLTAAANRIPVVIESDAPPGAVENAVYVASSEYTRGVEAGRAAAAYIENDPRYTGGTSVLLFGTPLDVIDRDIENGIRAGLAELSPDSTIIDVRPAARVLDVRNTLTTLLDDEIITFDVILTTSDAATYGVLQELDARGFVGSEVAVFSVGSELLARRFLPLEHGLLNAVAIDDGEATANALIDTAVGLLGGGIIPERIIVESATPLRAGDIITGEATDE